MSLDDKQKEIKENIRNAFKVVHSTYESISKLFILMKNELDNYGYVGFMNNGVYYLKELQDINGINKPERWFLNNAIVPMQKKSDDVLENGFIDAPVYAIEINLYQPWDEEPCIFLHRFEFKDIPNWSSGCKQNNQWIFYWPSRDKDKNNIIEINNDEYEIVKATPKTDEYSNKHWGYKSDYRMKIELVDLTSENIKEKIFDNFDYLDKIASGN